MRIFCVAALSLVSSLTFGQEWQDSLRTARKLYHEKKYSESLDKYKAAQRKAPKSVDLSDEVGQTAYKAEDFEQAEKSFAESLSNKTQAKDKAKAYHNLGNAKFKQKKYDEAIDAYKQSLRQNPNDEQTRYNLAEAMKKSAKKQQSQQGQQPKNQNGKQQQKSNQEPKQGNENQQQNQQNGQGKPQESKGNEQNSGSKLSDKRTEKALDELVKKEMETKKKLGSNKGKNTSSKSGKDW